MRWPMILTALTFGAAALAQQTSGKVNYFGTAGAKLYVDGQYVGTMPLSGELSEGEHTFRVEPTYGDPYELVRDVRFNGQLSLDLPISQEDVQPTPTDEGGNVMVNVFGTTGSVVSVDGKRAGMIPFSVVMATGRYEFTVQLPNGERYTVTKTVVDPGTGAAANLALAKP